MASNSQADWGEQDEQGVDLARLRYNLSLTDDQRLAQQQKAARFVLECMRAADPGTNLPKGLSKLRARRT